VISTNTINLQDQLIHKDIPSVRDALGLNLRSAVLKGRSNYLCPRRLETLRRLGPETAEEMRVLAKILVWLLEADSGDRAEINLTGPIERAVWDRISAADDRCTAETCLRRMGGICPFYRAHQAAHHAHLVIVNHALLLADVATGNRVLPEYSYLIVDEAHHLESAVTGALSFRVTEAELDRMLRELGSPRAGLLGRTLSLTQDTLPPDQYGYLNRLVEQATDRAFQFQNLSRNFFVTVAGFLEEQREGRRIGPYGHKERILTSTRSLPSWTEVEVVWDEAQANLHALLETLEQLGGGLAELSASGIEELEDLYSNLGNLFRRMSELYEKLNGLVFEPSEGLIYWAEISANGNRLALEVAPLHIGPLMQDHLWYQKEAIVLTSATLTAAGEFDYLRNRLYAEDAYELALGSPFDYESAAMLYLVNDIPEPQDRGSFQRMVNEGLIQLAREIGGRTLALFTSYSQLKQTARAITPALNDANIEVYEQGAGASPHTLLEFFRTADQAVLLGTRSFWEGVDVPGEALSALVIVKLPFDVPSDPIVAARAETFDDPFYQYALPEAILRFRQGFGRLIRTQMDRGVVVVLDRRLLTKAYGRAFIESLPQCTVVQGPLRELRERTAQWLNL
jgi:DNA polymerase-3 subunit epsilon/ATP-dependent DNA helicase DinG